MPGLKTNERPGTRAVLRHSRMSASKARQVLDLIRGKEVGRAAETLRATERDAASVVAKLLASAVANAAHNDLMDPDDLYVSACFADEGTTLKRWRPRARGRATRIRKRTCHITIIVSQLPEERLARRRAAREAEGAQRSRRVAESRRRADLSGRLSRRRAAHEAAAQAAETAEIEDELVEDAAMEQEAEDIVETVDDDDLDDLGDEVDEVDEFDEFDDEFDDEDDDEDDEVAGEDDGTDGATSDEEEGK